MKYKGHKKNGNDHQLTRRSMVTKQILHVSVLRKLENSMENLHDDVGVYRVTKHNLSFAAVVYLVTQRALSRIAWKDRMSE